MENDLPPSPQRGFNNSKKRYSSSSTPSTTDQLTSTNPTKKKDLSKTPTWANDPADSIQSESQKLDGSDTTNLISSNQLAFAARFSSTITPEMNPPEIISNNNNDIDIDNDNDTNDNDDNDNGTVNGAVNGIDNENSNKNGNKIHSDYDIIHTTNNFMELDSQTTASGNGVRTKGLRPKKSGPNFSAEADPFIYVSGADFKKIGE